MMYDLRKIGVLCLVGLLCACNQVTEMTSYRVHRDCYMDSEHLHRLTIDLRLDIPTEVRNPDLKQTVQNQVLEHYLGYQYAGQEPRKALNDYCQDHRAQYLSQSRNYISRRDYLELPLDSAEHWQVTTCYCRRNLLILQREQDYLAVNTRNGRQVSLQELLANPTAVEAQIHRPLPERFYIQDRRLVLLFDDGTGSLDLKSLRPYLHDDYRWLAW